jgi:hypothetical protein
MLRAMVIVEKFRNELEALGLTSTSRAKTFAGDLVKNHKGRRDIFRVPIESDGEKTLLFLKRNWRPYKKDGFVSFLKHGRARSLSRQEWENSRALNDAGFHTSPLVAVGEECSIFCEKFSFLVTESARGETVQHFLKECRDYRVRRKIFDALALEIRHLHDCGFATPDLFTRHIFVDEMNEKPRFCFIDMARLDRKKNISLQTRARDLAALNVTAPLHFVRATERLRFLKIYSGEVDPKLFGLIQKRVQSLLKRKKFRSFHTA